MRNGKRLLVRIACIAMMAAMVSAGKFALSAIPNVEIVTLLLALFGYVFGIDGVIAALVFVATEPLLYGVGTWLISYILFWPFVAFVFFLLGRRRVENRWAITAIAGGLVVWFGVLSSLVDVGLFSGYFERFFERFFIYYGRGIVFYAIEVACNLVLFPLSFLPLSRVLLRIRKKLYASF